MLDSPALLARAREAVEELETLLVELFAEAEGVPRTHPRPHLAAALTVAAYRTVYTETAGRLLAGARANEVLADHLNRLAAAFGAVERGLESFCTRGPSTDTEEWPRAPWCARDQSPGGGPPSG